jgi:hypothetical protein
MRMASCRQADQCLYRIRRKIMAQHRRQPRPPAESFMQPEEFCAVIASLGMDKATAAEFLCIGRATSFRYAAGCAAIPFAVAELLKIMLKLGIRPSFPPDRPRRVQRAA